jgi:hypothetical protein
MDVPRCAEYLDACGPLLRASTAYPKETFEAQRGELIEALLDCLGGEAYKKDPEIAMACGKAFSLWVDSTHAGGAGGRLGVALLEEPFDQAVSDKLGGASAGLYRLFTQCLMSSNPAKRTASM